MQLKNKILIYLIILFLLIIPISVTAFDFFGLFYSKPDLADMSVYHSYDQVYAQKYMQWMNNFEDIEYEKISGDTSTTLTVRNKIDNIKGYEINKQGFVIHLLSCDPHSYSCSFRINGVPTGNLFPTGKGKNTFNINNNYELRVESITIDYCMGWRYCDLDRDAYDIVDVVVKLKGE